MGMFDTVRCDYEIAPGITGVECQTKDIMSDLGGTLSEYYIDPAGKMWYIDYHGTYELEPRDNTIFRMKRVSTGQHGKVKPMFGFTSYLTIYPVGSSNHWLKARLHIVGGQVQSFTVNTEKVNDGFRNYCF